MLVESNSCICSRLLPIQIHYRFDTGAKWGNKMDKLIEELLNIENAAKENMNELDEERATLAQRIADEIARRSLEIRHKTDQAIQALKQEAEVNIQARLAEIESQCKQKAAQLSELFDTNATAWRKEWTNYVLQRGRL